MPTTPWARVKASAFKAAPGWTVMGRDPDRIEAVVVALRMLWVKYPDLRFGQLVRFITPAGRDAYYIEDDEWLASVLEILKRDEGSPGPPF